MYCGVRLGRTRDHVPPKALYAKVPRSAATYSGRDFGSSFKRSANAVHTVLPNPWPTVPSCEECNAGYAKDEEYFRLIVVGLLCHTATAEELFDDSITRSFERRSALENELFESLIVDDGRVALNIDEARISRIAVKIARGLLSLFGSRPALGDTNFRVLFWERRNEEFSRQIGNAFAFEPLLDGQLGCRFCIHDAVVFDVSSTTVPPPPPTPSS